MKTKIIEATNGPRNWGKFIVMRPDVEWDRSSVVAPPSRNAATVAIFGSSLLGNRGWSREHIIVFDLETNEGAAFSPGGSAHADLEKHKIWVCPLFEPFLEWLYQQDLRDLDALPDHIDLPNAPAAFAGYRRSGEG